MRYQIELDINLSRERLLELFLDADNLSEWQPDLVSFEHFGEHDEREVGAQSRQIHRMGRSLVEMTETVTVHNYPDEFAAIYESDDVWNLIENRFIEIDESKTKWILDSECKFSGLMRIMAFFMPGMMKKQTLTLMTRFKEFAETQS